MALDNLLLTIGDGSWTNYKVSFDAYSNTPYLRNYLGVRALDSDNMVALYWGSEGIEWVIEKIVKERRF